MKNWTTTPPTEPGLYLWRRKGARGWPSMVRLEDTGDKRMRVTSESVHRSDPRLFATARSLRGEWIGPVPE